MIALCHRYRVGVMSRKALQIYLDGQERSIVEDSAIRWGVSLSAAVRRIVRESRKVQ